MLKRLRMKFVLVNMIIVTIIRCLIFAILYIFTGRNLERESTQMMRTIAMNPMKLMQMWVFWKHIS